MGLKDVLEKMKLVEVGDDEAATAASPNPPPHPGAPGTRRPTAPAPPRPSIGDIVQKTPPPSLDEKVLPKAPGDPIPDFPAIFQASGVKDPPHGFTAYKVLEILSSADFASLDAKAKAAALSGFLRMNPSGPVAIADVIQDAVARDQALDHFEGFLLKKLESRGAEIEKENAALQAEIDELTRRNKEKMEANRKTIESERQRIAEWQARKRIEERKLFDAVAPFVEHNPVSLGSAPPAKG
jgi:hypothetical protein